jgi:hypothetical protein
MQQEVVVQARASCPTGREPHCDVIRVTGAFFSPGGGTGPESNPRLAPVNLSTFRMDRFEVTVARFRRYVEAGMPRARFPLVYPGDILVPLHPDAQTPQRPRPFDMGQMRVTWTEDPGPFEDRPINNVTVATAQSFCAWDGGRLPTEAQWEWAAFYNTTNRSGSTFPGGESAACDDAVFGQLLRCPIPDDKVPGPLPVGSRRQEGLFFDLGGNVREFTAGIAFSYEQQGVYGCRRGFAGLDPVCLSRRELSAGFGANIPQVHSACYSSERPSTRDDRLVGYSEVTTDAQVRAYALFTSPQVGFRCAYEEP